MVHCLGKFTCKKKKYLAAEFCEFLPKPFMVELARGYTGPPVSDTIMGPQDQEKTSLWWSRPCQKALIHKNFFTEKLLGLNDDLSCVK